MRSALAGLAVAVALLAAPAAQASDESLRKTVVAQQTKLEKAAKRYEKAVRTVDTAAELSKAKRETQKLAKITQTYHDKVSAEQADTTKYKRARTKLLDALSTYKRGLDKLVAAIDAKSESKVKSALKTIVSAGKKFDAAAKAFS